MNKLGQYILVAKPGIIFGNLTSVAAGFLLASRGHIDTALLLIVLAGIGLVIASGCVFNNCFDRDLDRIMVRTQNRIMARKLISPQTAIIYASLLGAAGIFILLSTANTLSVMIVLAGLVLYAGLYSLYLKRASVYATLIGSLAGAAPPLAGYCAVTNRFDSGAAILLAIFCLWQVPHSYAIAIYRLQDYAAAAIPVLPVKGGVQTAKIHIVAFIGAFMAATLMLSLSGYAGYLFLAVGSLIGLVWLIMAWSGLATSDNRTWARRIFVFSLLAIIVLNVMMSIDSTTFGVTQGPVLVSQWHKAR